MQRPAADDRDCDDDVDDCDWPMDENVLRTLSEDVRPTPAAGLADSDGAVASAVRLCSAERVVPTAETVRRLRLRQLLLRRPPRWWPENGGGAAAVAESRRTQTKLMSVPSAYPATGEYYAPEAAYVSRTVEELSSGPRPTAAPPVNGYTYTAGTVRYDRETGACYLHGFADPQARVTVDCALLTDVLPRHRATVKMYSTLRPPPADDPGGPPVLAPHHFQVFSRAVLFR
ncbi:uncharacterized protein LOC113560838 [Rhopalosiphum maidis]|uniref:uncharacterized protein LOC113560838 n=1 Tax=Rhopalosiphum maidis TaxID=43146 RepID=UPI000EFF2E43|nr:uncharacterized protein LOC113560838 [Rhopalosiphum maidis]XP_026822741.1 uncharacterized protein LOC113560838 [Rhopalosiphum maidis]